MVEIIGEHVCLTVNGEVIATAQLSRHVAADGLGGRIVSRYPARLFIRDQRSRL